MCEEDQITLFNSEDNLRLETWAIKKMRPVPLMREEDQTHFIVATTGNVVTCHGLVITTGRVDICHGLATILRTNTLDVFDTHEPRKTCRSIEFPHGH